MPRLGQDDPSAAAQEEKFARIVVITGATAGVGRAIALRFSGAGAQVALIARDEAALKDVVDEISAYGGIAIACPCDVADASAMNACADEIERKLGPIEIWMNVAMVTVFSRLRDMDPQEFRRVTEVAYLGYVYGTMAALRVMTPRNRGQIIQIGSALAYRGIPLQSAYCGAKHAIRGFTNSLRTELIHDRVNVTLTMIQLPAVNTPQFDWARCHMQRAPRPVGQIYEPEAIADAVFAAARRPKREYWLGFDTALAILGDMAAPWLLDRYLAHNAFEAQERSEPTSPTRKDNLFAPVYALHRVRGSFSAGAKEEVSALSGTYLRAAAIAAIALSGAIVAKLIL